MTSDRAAALLAAWRADLESWAIPDEILRQAGESPWELPVALFARRAEEQLAVPPDNPSYRRAREALAPGGEPGGEPGGAVLDVGAGGGAASLPLARWATSLTAVDTHPGMLADLAARAARLGVAVRTVEGRWPDVAGEVPVADLVVCHHVLYNVPDLGEFALALDAHARRRVVLELTERHPLSSLDPLWRRFHGLARPQRPDAAQAVEALRALGLDARAERWARPGGSEHASFDALVELTRRRLCLPPERAAELAGALVDLGVDPAHPMDLGARGRALATVWWPGGEPGGEPGGASA